MARVCLDYIYIYWQNKSWMSSLTPTKFLISCYYLCILQWNAFRADVNRPPIPPRMHCCNNSIEEIKPVKTIITFTVYKSKNYHECKLEITRNVLRWKHPNFRSNNDPISPYNFKVISKIPQILTQAVIYK